MLRYRSPRRLCWLAEGFVLGAGDHYGQSVRLSQSSCLHEDGDCCLTTCVFRERDEPDAGRAEAAAPPDLARDRA